jgi:tetratricopeptide (TPR) repeat protein
MASRLVAWRVAPVLVALVTAVAFGADGDVPRDAPPGEADAAAERFWQVVRKRPTRGTAFDLWYRHALDAGTLEDLVGRVEREAKAAPDDPAAQVLLGLVYERRGRDDEAATRYERARSLAPGDYYPRYLLGTLRARQGRFEDAAQALAEALDRDPPRGELLEIQKRLGQIQMRMGKAEQALQTWAKLAERFPDDRRVLTELAELLADEGRTDEAIAQWQRVAALAGDDRHLALSARVEIAQLQVRRGNPKAAVELFDRALDQVDPESWLAKDLHRKIEAIFLRRDDAKGLVAYYEDRSARHPDELATRLRLASAQGRAGRPDAAIAQYREALKVAPSRRDVREALVGELTRAGRLGDALAEARALAEKWPNDADALRQLGQLTLKAAPAEKRREAEAEAAAVYRKIAAIKPDDPALALQAAEACRQAARGTETGRPSGREGEGSPAWAVAEELYREAARRSKGAPAYLEYLGEFLHAAGRKGEALAAWAGMAEPADKAEGWRRLAEVEARFGYLDEAVAAGAKGVAAEPDNFGLREFQSALLLKAKEYDRALAEVAELDRLASAPAEVEKAIRRRVEVLSASGKVDAEIARLRSRLDAGKGSSRDHWMLGMLLADRGRFAAAARSLDLALEGAKDEPRLLKAAAEVHEQAGDRKGALRLYRRLAEAEPGRAAAHFEKIAGLELDLGATTAAKDAAEAFLRRAPGDLDAYRLRAEVAFRLGQVDDGLHVLSRAVRVAPRDVAIRAQLARALAERGRPDEASEHAWRCLELADSLDAKLAAVDLLADLAEQARTLDRLVESLRRLARGPQGGREVVLCLAEVLRRGRNYADARRELDRLLVVNPDDLDVLKLLAALAAQERDWAAAVRYQDRVANLAPDRANLETLADYHEARGDAEEATRVWRRLLELTGGPDTLIEGIDRELRRGSPSSVQEAASLARLGLSRWPDDWRLRLRAGLASLVASKDADASADFEALLARPEPPSPPIPTSPGPVGSPPSLPELDEIAAALDAWRLFPGPNRGPALSATILRPWPQAGRTPGGQAAALQAQRAALQAQQWALQVQQLAALQAEQSSAQVAQITAEMTALRERRRAAVTPAEQARIDARLVSLQSQIAAINSQQAQVQASQPSTTPQVAQITAEIRALQQRRLAATTPAEQAQIDARIAALQGQFATFNGLPPTQVQLRQQAALVAQAQATMAAQARVQAIRVAPPGRVGLTIVPPAKDERAGRAQAAVCLYLLSQRKSEEEAWLRATRERAATEPVRLHDLLLVELADGRFLEAFDDLGRLARARPDDALPHVVRLFVTNFNGRDQLAALPADERDRRRADERESFGWLIGRRPDLRLPLTQIYGEHLLHELGDADEAARLAANALASADRVEELVAPAELAARAGDIALTMRIFKAAAELAATRGDSPSSLEALETLLADNGLFSADDDYLAAILALLDHDLGHPDARWVGGGRGPGSRGRSGALPAMYQKYQQALSKGMVVQSPQAQPGQPQPSTAFPGPVPYLDAPRLELLRQVQGRFEAAGKLDLLTSRLARRAGEAKGEARLGYALAGIAVRWWSNGRDPALAELQRLAQSEPDDAWLALSLARALLAQNEPRPALDALDRIKPGSGVAAAEVDALRVEAANRLFLGSRDQALDALLHELDSRGHEPELSPLFPQARPAAAGGVARVVSRATPNAPQVTYTTAAPAPTPAPAAPGGSTTTTTTLRTFIVNAPAAPGVATRPDLRDLIALAKTRGDLKGLEQSASARWDEHPQSSRLGATVTLARLARSDPDGALQAARRWAELLRGRPELASEPEALWVATACLAHAQTRSLGRQLARDILPAIQLRGAGNARRELLLQLVQGAVEDGEKEQAIEFLRQLRELMEAEGSFR